MFANNDNLSCFLVAMTNNLRALCYLHCHSIYLLFFIFVCCSLCSLSYHLNILKFKASSFPLWERGVVLKVL